MATRTASKPYAKKTKAELEELARERDIDGRSQMTKDELVTALERDDTGPDALELLVDQHDRIKELFESLSSRATRPSKAKLDDVRELVSTLVKHAEIEELVFYPAVREALSDDDLVDEGLEEHHAAELLMWELERLPADAPRYDAKVTVLKENVLHHIEEEETELFPKVEKTIGEDRRRELGAA
ncbi:MAG: hemerythrin domain-containing protein, partial [Nitriliruptor sp.]